MQRVSLLINLSHLKSPLTGVGIYSTEVVSRLLKDERFDISVILRDEVSYLFDKNIRRIGLSRFEKKMLNTKSGLIAWNLLFLRYRAKSVDVVYAPASYGGFLKNQYITIHDLIGLSFATQNLGQYAYFRFLLPIIVKWSKSVITISKFAKRDIISRFGINEDDVLVSYNGHNYALTVVPHSDNFILIVGCSYSHKNVEDAIHLLRVSGMENIRLKITGAKNRYVNGLRQLAINHDVEDRVEFLGFVDSDKLVELYKNCQLYLSCSLMEGFGLTPLEALSYNKQVVLSNIEVFKEVYGDVGIFYQPKDVIDLASKIKEAINTSVDPEKINDLLVKYNWDSTCQNIANKLLK